MIAYILIAKNVKKHLTFIQRYEFLKCACEVFPDVKKKYIIIQTATAVKTEAIVLFNLSREDFFVDFLKMVPFPLS